MVCKYFPSTHRLSFHSVDSFLCKRCLVWYQAQSFSYVWLFVTAWTIAHQAPLSMGLSQQEYWIRLLFPPPRDLPDPRSKPAGLDFVQLLHWQADSLSLSHLGSPLVWCGPIYFVFLPVILISYCHWHNQCLFSYFFLKKKST